MLKKTLKLIAILLCILIGLYPLTYFFINGKTGFFALKRDEVFFNLFWNIGFYIHILFGGLALLIGWLQFSKTLRIKHSKIHKTIGKIYVVSAILSSLASLYISFFAEGGIIAVVGFLSVGLIWLYSTTKGYIEIRNGKFLTHQQLMIYSYAVCFGGVTLRFWLSILRCFINDFALAYTVVAWLSWVPNVLVARIIVQQQIKRQQNQRH